jgi:hypothetical protein
LLTRSFVRNSQRGQGVPGGAASRLLPCVLGMLLAAPAGAQSGAPRAWLPPGSYRLEMRVAAQAELPQLGPTETVTVSVSRVEIRHERGALVQHHRVCRMWDASDGAVARVRFPEAFVAALAPTRVRSALVRTRDGRVRYEADLGREWLGMQAGAPLPSDPDDAAVRDSDGDGQPGVTIQLGLTALPDAELHLAQHTHTVLRGWLEEPGRLRGRIEMREFGQSVLAATPSFLRHEPRVRHDPTRSSFELVRDDGSKACAGQAEETARTGAGEAPPAATRAARLIRP